VFREMGNRAGLGFKGRRTPPLHSNEPNMPDPNGPSSEHEPRWDEFPNVGASIQPAPKDPAQVAATRLLAQAVQAAGTTFVDAAGDGVVTIVLVPTQAWVAPAHAAWRADACHSRSPEDGFRTYYRLGPNWVSWKPEIAPRDHDLRNGADTFAMAVAAGCHCCAVTCELAWVPSDLDFCADYRLVLPLLTGMDIRVVAKELCGDHPLWRLPDELAALVTPRLLRLAHRPGQTADEYLLKLKVLLDRDQQTRANEATLSSRSVCHAPRLDRLHGMAEPVAWGMALAKDLSLYREGNIPWSDVDGGLLLSGPPGTGKTLFARALAETCQVPLVTGSYQDWLGTGTAHQGDLLKSMKQTFKKARDCAPCILFIDEVDSFPNRGTLRHAYSDWDIQVVNALLAELDGAQGRPGVVVLAACNHPHLLDPALIRSGRLDRHIRLSLPDTTALVGILRQHLGNDLLDADLTPAALAAAGATGADVERFVRSARRRARNAGRPIGLDDLLAELSEGDQRTPSALWIAALHEAGHAVAFLELDLGTLSAVSLRAAGSSGGVTVTTGSGLLTASRLHRQLVARLAGRAAEEVIAGEPSAGAGGGPDSDLAIATEMAAAAAGSFGLDSEAGLAWFGLTTAETLPSLLRKSPWLAGRVRQVLKAAYADAIGLAQRERHAIEALATALLERGALEGQEAVDIMVLHREGGDEPPSSKECLSDWDNARPTPGASIDRGH
jgi:cell division protease FtsH